MNLVINPRLELNPRSIDRKGAINLRFSVGADTVTRACERIVVGGKELPTRECFPVTGTFTSLQIEKRQIEVTPPPGVDFVRIDVFVAEVNAANQPIAPEQQASANLRIDGALP